MFNPVVGGSGGAYHCHGEHGECDNEAQHLWQGAKADLKQIRQDEQKLKADERHHAGERKIERDERKEATDIGKLIGTILGLG